MTAATAPAATDELLRTLYAMAFLVEARDPYTGGHLWRVSQLSARLAVAEGLSRTETAAAALGGFLHDVGKVGVPDAILNKRGSLTDAEYAVVKTHPEVGGRVLLGHPLVHLIEAAVIGHHERVDGRGYPAGLRRDALPVAARIVALADAFDAMTSTRPYRRGLPIDETLARIAGELDRQFDRTLAERFIALGRAGEFDGIVGHSEPGIPLHECPMCGPVVVVRRDHQPGDPAFCRVCGTAYRLTDEGGRMHLGPTVRASRASDLQPDIDHGLLVSLIEDVALHLRVPAAPSTDGWWARTRRLFFHAEPP